MNLRIKIILAAFALSVATTVASYGVRHYANSEYQYELQRMGSYSMIVADHAASEPDALNG
jgi:hypothetical protein